MAAPSAGDACVAILPVPCPGHSDRIFRPGCPALGGAGRRLSGVTHGHCALSRRSLASWRPRAGTGAHGPPGTSLFGRWMRCEGWEVPFRVFDHTADIADDLPRIGERMCHNVPTGWGRAGGIGNSRSVNCGPCSSAGPPGRWWSRSGADRTRSRSCSTAGPAGGDTRSVMTTSGSWSTQSCRRDRTGGHAVGHPGAPP